MCLTKKYILMREITDQDYQEFVKTHDEIIVQDRIGHKAQKIKIGQKHHIKITQPTNFQMEGTTVWSFPHRGNWATHKGDFRGNWAPEIPRNLILRYSALNELVMDQMCGSGTTLVEAKLLGRNAIGVDINENCIMLTRDRLNFRYPQPDLNFHETWQRTYVGDARYLNEIPDESVDLIATHPPYANIIPYSKEKVEGDLSHVYDIKEFIEEMRIVATECYRVLKPNRYCAILIGDTRRTKHYVPIAYRVLQGFLEAGFILKENVIKHQWQCKSTPFWLEKSIKSNFLLIMHEHLFIFRKPAEGENINTFKDSISW